MSNYPFIYGAILTLGIILPLGAQNIFIFNQGLQHPRFMDAWPSIIAATLCDFILICSAIFGLTYIILQIEILKNVILLAGGIFLCYLSYSLWTKAATPLAEMKPYSWTKQITYALSVSLINPHALIDTFLIIGSNAILFTSLKSKLQFGLSCGITELLWFSSVCLVGNRLRRIPNNDFFIMMINRIAAIIIFGIAISILFSLVKNFL